PKTLPELERFHPVLRRAIFDVLTVDERHSLWRAHLEEWVSSSELTTDAQRALIQDVMEKLPLYLDGSDGRERMLADGLDSRIRASFPLELARSVFLVLGSADFDATQPIGIGPTNNLGLSPLSITFSRETGFSVSENGAAAD